MKAAASTCVLPSMHDSELGSNLNLTGSALGLLSSRGSREFTCQPTVFCPLQVSAVKYHTKAISTFHQINAFEEDGFLMLDLCCADDGKAINNYLLQNLRKSGEALNEVRASRGIS